MTTGRLWRTRVSTSISDMPAAPSPYSSTTWLDGLAMRAAMAAPMPAPRQPYGPGSSQPPGQLGLDELAGERHEVTAVADHDGVVAEAGQQLAVDACRVDRVGRRREQLAVAGRGCCDLVLQRAEPRGPVGATPVLGGSGQRVEDAGEHLGQVAAGGRSHLGMRRDLAGGVGDVHRLGRGRAFLAAEDAVTEAEVQRCADDDHEVGLVERGRAGLGHQLWVSAGDDAATHAVGDDRDPGLLDELAAQPPRRGRPRHPYRARGRDAPTGG